jgi:hypothetical protein
MSKVDDGIPIHLKHKNKDNASIITWSNVDKSVTNNQNTLFVYIVLVEINLTLFFIPSPVLIQIHRRILSTYRYEYEYENWLPNQNNNNTKQSECIDAVDKGNVAVGHLEAKVPGSVVFVADNKTRHLIQIPLSLLYTLRWIVTLTLLLHENTLIIFNFNC